VLRIWVKFETFIGAKIGRWRRDGWHRVCWCWWRETTILWTSRVRAKGYVALLACIVIQVAPSLLSLKSPQLAFGD